MAAFVSVVCTYRFNNVGTLTDDDVEAAVGAVALIFDTPFALGLSLTSDATSIESAGIIDRVLTFSLVIPTMASTNNPPIAVPFTGSIVSSSPNDTAGGTGARTVTLTYFDPTAGEHTEVIALDGQTPVAMVNSNKATLVSIVPTTTGSFGTNEGVLFVFADPYQAAAQGAPSEYTTRQPAQQVASLPAGYYVNDPGGAQVVGLMDGIFSGQFRAALGFPPVNHLTIAS